MLSNWLSWWKKPADPEPRTLAAEQANRHLSRPVVFDPALKHRVRAYRAGEPTFGSDAEAGEWRQCRLQVLHHVLRVVQESRWRDHLILRGSALMGTWFGDRARPPGDLDWVVTPQSWKPRRDQLVPELMRLLEGTTVGNGVTIPLGSHVREEIWLYEKAPGVRVVLPWDHPDARRGGTVQMDFVFGESMPTPPRTTEVQLGNLPPVSLLAASPEQSLAWKIVWLATDMYSAAKDLYDAVLLAEGFPVSAAVVRASFLPLGAPDRDLYRDLSPRSVDGLRVEWDDFMSEYPFVSEPLDHWKARLATALGPLFTEIADQRHPPG